jgi:N-acetylneuraminic acid mutarotase
MKTLKLISSALILLITTISYSQTNEFIWESGFNTRNMAPVFGTKGISNPAHYPGSREDAVCWSDAQGNVWLFGGKNPQITSSNGHSMNDLWKYNPTTNEWTWMTGSNVPSSSGSYGSIGFPAASNNPPARYAAAAWTDNSGNLWMFGGIKEPGSGVSPLYNDLWKYNTTTNQWTWVSGSNATDQNSAYGTMGVPDVSNIPGARAECSYWKDADGNLMLYGGSGYSIGVKGFLNQLWKYDIATNEWTYVKGVTTVNSLPTFGTQGVAASTNKPGSRSRCAGWEDDAGNVWIYGGNGYGQNPSVGPLNDMWKLDATTNLWTWFSGSSGTLPVAPVYGVTGVGGINNTPGTRSNPASWKDTLGNLWIFGGLQSTSTLRCDLWKFNPTTGMWAYMNGSKISNSDGLYGTMGGPSYYPGSRMYTAYCADKNGNFILYGGIGYDISTVGSLADLWFYDTPEAPLPSITSFSSTTSCGNSATLTINGTNLTSATVSIGGTTITPLATNTNTQITATINSGTNGLITITTADGNTTSLTSFSLNPLPVISVNSGSVCSGNSFTINPSGASTYTISGGLSVVTPTTNATYSVTGTSAEGCVSSNTALSSVTVNSLPIVSATSSNSLICTGESATLTATGASTYTWSTSDNTNAISVSPTVTTTYTLSGTDGNGCENTSTFTQSVSLCTGVASLTKEGSISVYPNPFNALFTISGIELNTNISIYNTIGELVKTVQSVNTNASIDLSGYSNGIYFIKIQNDKGEVIQKLIKY